MVRILLSLFLVAMALQPLSLQACAMDGEAGGSHHVEMQAESAHACCEPDAPDTNTGCNAMAQCATGASALTVIPTHSVPDSANLSRHFLALDDARPATAHTSPPFRPPIS